VLRLAAVGDLHSTERPAPAARLRPHLSALAGSADLLVLAGDLTTHGRLAEARPLADDLAACPVPVVAVLGNHDHDAGQADLIRALLQDRGVTVLERESAVVDLPGGRLGVAGTKGFGGGFRGACGSEFGEPEMKAFMRHTRAVADALSAALDAVGRCDRRLALVHYAPVEATLEGERREIYPFLGSHLLGDAIDRAGADLVVHGHAHRGAERGVTDQGIPVRNVAQPVHGRPYVVYEIA
jgi:Icc-related predicted phosphoesterase